MIIPSAWRKESAEWAEDRNLPQSVINDIERRLIEFRIKRDRYQAERRAAELPGLKLLAAALKSEIDGLRRKIDTMGKKDTKGLAWAQLAEALHHNHERDALYSNMLELSWPYQYVNGQVEAIEAGMKAATPMVITMIPATKHVPAHDHAAVAVGEGVL